MLRSSLYLALGAAILIGSAGCSGGDKGPLTISAIQLNKDDGSGGDGDTVTGFKPGDGAIHCQAQLNKVQDGTKIGVTLIAVDAGGAKNQTITTTTLTTNGVTNTADAKFTLPRPWPVGSYQCASTLNGAPSKTVDFNVAE